MWPTCITTAFLQADGFGREVFLRAPVDGHPHGAGRFRRPWALASGLNDVPAALCETLHQYLRGERDSPAMVGLNFKVSTFDQCLHFVRSMTLLCSTTASTLLGVSWGQCWALGPRTTHIDDALGCGHEDVLRSAQQYLGRRFGCLWGPIAEDCDWLWN